MGTTFRMSVTPTSRMSASPEERFKSGMSEVSGIRSHLLSIQYSLTLQCGRLLVEARKSSPWLALSTKLTNSSSDSGYHKNCTVEVRSSLSPKFSNRLCLLRNLGCSKRQSRTSVHKILDGP